MLEGQPATYELSWISVKHSLISYNSDQAGIVKYSEYRVEILVTLLREVNIYINVFVLCEVSQFNLYTCI